MTKVVYQPSELEEKVSFITHLPGILLGIFLTTILVFKPNITLEETISYLVYGVTFVLIYAASAKYHLCPPGDKKNVLKKIDHACIYLFMAGCYTPFVVVKMLPTYQTYFLCIVWMIAILGVSYKLISANENRLISLTLYILFGLMCFFAGDDLLGQLSSLSYNLLAIGGVFYIVGIVFYLTNRIPFNHGIWHIFVLLGSITQFFSIYYI